MDALAKFTDVEILARTAYGENRGGGEVGMQSVINVINNRSHKPGWWGHSIRTVCLMHAQFSCWLETDPNYAKITTVTDADPAYALALEMATECMTTGLEDLTNGATYYFAESMKQWPKWAEGHKPCAEIAKQLFFNDVV